MSYTTTQTKFFHKPGVTQLTLHSPIEESLEVEEPVLKEKVVELVKKMENSWLFSQNELKELEQFSKDFAQCKFDPSSKESRMDVSLLLCILLYIVRDNALGSCKQLDNYEEELLEILKITIHPAAKVNEFVDLFMEKFLVDRTASIDARYQNQMKKLDQLNRRIQQAMKEQLFAFQQLLCEEHDLQIEKCEQLNEKANLLQKRLKEIQNLYQAIGVTQAEIGDKMEKFQHDLYELAQQFEHINKKV